MFRKITLMLLVAICLAGCAVEQVTDLEPNIFAFIVDEAWERQCLQGRCDRI